MKLTVGIKYYRTYLISRVVLKINSAHIVTPLYAPPMYMVATIAKDKVLLILELTLVHKIYMYVHAYILLVTRYTVIELNATLE